MKNRIHFSWLLCWVCLGVLVGNYLSIEFSRYAGYESLGLCILLLTVGFIRKNKGSILVVLLAGLVLGLWRGSMEHNAQKNLENIVGDNVYIVGVVSTDADHDVEGDNRFILKNLLIEGKKISGNLWVSTNSTDKVERSDIVMIRGLVSSGFGTFPAAIYRAEILKIKPAGNSDVGRIVRDWFSQKIHNGIKEPGSSLAGGFLLGQKTELPEKLDQELKLLGLTHIVVASGFNLTILVRFARRLFIKVSRFTALTCSFLLIYMFNLITGNSPSMSRASLIATISLLAWYFGRKIHPIVLISFSAAVTVLVNPSYGWGDVGWLLSFTSFIGVIILSPLINSYFWGDEKPGVIRQVFIETMSAQAVALPVTLYFFGHYTILSLVANALILPLIPFAMLLVFILGLVVATDLSFLISVFSFPVQKLLDYMVAVVSRLAEYPQADSEIIFKISNVVTYYVFLLIAVIFLKLRSNYQFRDYNVIE